MIKKKVRKVKNVRTYYLGDSDFELQQHIDDLASKERVSLSAVILDALLEYWQKHGDGNPVFTLDQFQDLNFAATPALCRPSKNWDIFLSKATPQIKEEIKNHIIRIDHILVKYL